MVWMVDNLELTPDNCSVLVRSISNYGTVEERSKYSDHFSSIVIDSIVFKLQSILNCRHYNCSVSSFDQRIRKDFFSDSDASTINEPTQ